MLHNKTSIFDKESANKKSVEQIVAELTVDYNKALQSFNEFKVVVQQAYANQSPSETNHDSGIEYHIQKTDFTACEIAAKKFMTDNDACLKKYMQYYHAYKLPTEQLRQLKDNFTPLLKDLDAKKNHVHREIHVDLQGYVGYVYRHPDPEERLDYECANGLCPMRKK